MGIFDAINVSESAMGIHRFRVEVAAENLANVYTKGYRSKHVDLQANNFTTALKGAQSGTGGSAAEIGSSSGGFDAISGAVRIGSITRNKSSVDDDRQEALQATGDMMQAKSAFELNMRAATLLKSMALSSLEIGRGA